MDFNNEDIENIDNKYLKYDDGSKINEITLL
jgi:hypothetical protein